MKLSNRLGRKKVRYANPNRTIGNSIQSKDCMLFFAYIWDLWRSLIVNWFVIDLLSYTYLLS